MPRMTTAAAMLVVASLAAGCATTSETMVRQGFPPAYAQGLDDGCRSGRKAGGSLFDQFRKDVRRFDVDHDYATGCASRTA